MPWMIPAAIIGSSLIGSKMQAGATSEATQANTAQQQANLEFQKRMYEDSLARLQKYEQPGFEDYNRLRQLMMGGPEAAQKFLTMSPSYGFRLSEGMKALDRQAAARGGLISGSALKAAQRYGQDVASQEYENEFNRLANLAKVGPATAGMQVELGSNYGNRVGGIYSQMGETAANAALARGSAYQRGFGDISYALGRYMQPGGYNALGGSQRGPIDMPGYPGMAGEDYMGR